MKLKGFCGKLSEMGSSVKIFLEVFLELIPEMYKHFKLKSIFVAPFILVASLLYFIYKKITD